MTIMSCYDAMVQTKCKINKRNCLILSNYAYIRLSYADSNHDKQNQNLLCYHYTIGQS